jgi:membrane-bound lytic murein transglycosylase D
MLIKAGFDADVPRSAVQGTSPRCGDTGQLSFQPEIVTRRDYRKAAANDRRPASPALPASAPACVADWNDVRYQPQVPRGASVVV